MAGERERRERQRETEREGGEIIAVARASPTAARSAAVLLCFGGGAEDGT